MVKSWIILFKCEQVNRELRSLQVSLENSGLGIPLENTPLVNISFRNSIEHLCYIDAWSYLKADRMNNLFQASDTAVNWDAIV